LQEPILSLAHTRFRLDWQWDGLEAVLQSRCIDETGYVQPTVAELVRVRGRNWIYYNNGIQSWKVAAEGRCHNVPVKAMVGSGNRRAPGRGRRPTGAGPVADLRRWPPAHYRGDQGLGSYHPARWPGFAAGQRDRRTRQAHLRGTLRLLSRRDG